MTQTLISPRMIIGLQSALDAKMPLSGGTITHTSGYLTINQYDAEEAEGATRLQWSAATRTLTFSAIGDGEGDTNLDGLGDVTAAGNLSAFSDIRLKSDIVTITDALAKLNQIRGITFTMKGKRMTGVIAQDVQAVLPEAVNEADDEIGTLSVAYGNLVGLLIEAIKELKAEVDELKRAA